MGKMANAFISGLKSSGQQELANYHMRFNEFLGTGRAPMAMDDKASAELYASGNVAWVNIALNRKMLDIGNIDYYMVDEAGNKIEWKNVPDELAMPLQSGFAGMTFNDMIAVAGGHEDLSGNALWVKSTDKNRYSQLTNTPYEFFPVAPGCFKININSKGTAIESYDVRYKDGTTKILTPEQVLHFKRNSIISPFVGIGLISQGRSLVEFESVALDYQITFLEKDGTPDLIYIDKNMHSPDAAKAKAAQLRAEYKNGKYSNSIMYAAGEIDIKSFAVSSHDLQFIENRKYNADQVISLMESTGSMLGIPDANNRASAVVLTNNYYGIVNSRVAHLVDVINKQFVLISPANKNKKIKLSFTPYPTGDIETIRTAVNNGLMTPANGAKELGLPFDEKNEATNALYITRSLGTLQSVFEALPLDFSAGALADIPGDVKKKLKRQILDYQSEHSQENSPEAG